MRRREPERLKQERGAQIKHLTAQISALQSEIAKRNEQREDCLKCKEFLDKLTPQEWFLEQQRIKEAEIEALRQEEFVCARGGRVEAV